VCVFRVQQTENKIIRQFPLTFQSEIPALRCRRRSAVLTFYFISQR